MNEERRSKQREDPKRARERSKTDDPTRQTERQIDDNQDDLGRDANDPRQVANEINKTGH
jgi:hypothetical protein